MKVSVLASGSSGNCFYVENEESAVLIDAGISAKQIVERLGMIKKNPEKIKGIFITHEHSDHIKGVDVFARNFNIPVFATKKTAKKCFLCSNQELVHLIKNNEVVDLGEMKVESFSKSHTAIDPVSYNVFNGKKVSIITDLGYSCRNVLENVSDSDFLCLESNHDIRMLDDGPYPFYLKKWIKSDKGHLSNMQAGLCVLEHASSKLKNVVLSHISKTNNTPLLALTTFSGLVKERSDLTPRICVSNREIPTSLLKV
ncbi:MBL fold metallo-hydrolase [Candidatus Pacearchaeota archaeon]|nr:MBL fold metallo-hydrolase [Candidatus Pacearchaeota archaeon]